VKSKPVKVKASLFYKHNMRLNVMSSLLSTYARPGVSKINGVGMISVRNITKGTKIHKLKPIQGSWFPLEWAELHEVETNVVHMMQDYVCCSSQDPHDYVFVPKAPITEFSLGMLLNHSTDPNVEINEDNFVVASKDISVGEELTEDYLCICGKNYLEYNRLR